MLETAPEARRARCPAPARARPPRVVAALCAVPSRRNPYRPPSLASLPNGSRLSCGALKKDSFPKCTCAASFKRLLDSGRANLNLRPGSSPKKIEDHGPADGNPDQGPQVAPRDCVHDVTEQIDRENAYRQATAPLRLNP